MADSPSIQQPRIATPIGAAPRADTALLAAWLVSVAAHVVLFAVMVAVPWIARETSGSTAPAVTSTQLRHRESKVRTSMLPDRPQLEQSQRPAPPSRHVKPHTRSSLSELDRVSSRSQTIIGVGTGGGEFSKYGLHAGSAGGPQFFGLGPEGRAARKIVYVVDHSASMIEVFDDVRKELKRSIARLRKSQKFHVIFYSSGSPLRHPLGKLVNAIRTAKEAAFEFIDAVPVGGGTEELPALKQAFSLKPDIIYFLSDGELYDRPVLLEKLQEWNAEKQVRIFTIAFVFPEGKELLELIAREHDGEFRFVSEYDLE